MAISVTNKFGSQQAPAPASGARRDAASTAAKPMAALAEHNAKRAIEAKVFELRDELEDGDVDEVEIDRRCEAYRATLVGASSSSHRPPNAPLCSALGTASAAAMGVALVAPKLSAPEVDAERMTPVILLRQLLSDREIEECFEAEATAARRYPRTAKFDGEATEVTGSPSHHVLYLHRDGFFSRSHAPLCDKLVAAMKSGGVPFSGRGLAVRCVEMHRYGVGGSLLIPGHRDIGSALSLSVLLSDSTSFDGGRFVTYDDAGDPVVHEIGRGDGVLFHSEKVHHVSTVTRGERRALVVELWTNATNTHDRTS